MADLDKLDIKQLEALIAKAHAARAELREKRRKELRADFERRCASEGFTLAEIVSVRPTKTKAPKYAHPSDPSLMWTGLGRVPTWLKKLAGNDGIERFRIAQR